MSSLVLRIGAGIAQALAPLPVYFGAIKSEATARENLSALLGHLDHALVGLTHYAGRSSYGADLYLAHLQTAGEIFYKVQQAQPRLANALAVEMNANEAATLGMRVEGQSANAPAHIPLTKIFSEGLPYLQGSVKLQDRACESVRMFPATRTSYRPSRGLYSCNWFGERRYHL